MGRVLLLPGTEWQVPLIRRIKEKGHDVYLVNPVKNAGIWDVANHFLESDIFAYDAIERYARENKIDAVLSDECDIAMPVVAELGRRLQVTTLSCEAAALYTNKLLMHKFSESIGAKMAEYRLCGKCEDAVAFLNMLGRPIILKPIDSNASHGVFKAESEWDIREHFDEALSFSKGKKAVLAERYIGGPEFTADGIKTPERHFTLSISEKKHFRHNENIANELLFMHSNEKYDYEKLKKVNNRFVEKSPLVFGLTHAEYKYEDGEFYLLEIGARGGGNLISSVITPYLTGIELYDYLINCSLGKVYSVPFTIPESHRNRAAVLKFFDTPRNGGTVKDVLGLEYLKKEKSIVSYALRFSPGDTLKEAENDSDRIGYYIACSESKEALAETMNQVDKHFKIRILEDDG